METFKELETLVKVDFGPRDVKFPKYGNTIGKAEADETVLSLLEFWQQNEDWKAVLSSSVCKMMGTTDIGDDYTPSHAEIGMKYLLVNKYIVTQCYGKGNDVVIYLAPTEKLLDVMRPFVQKGERTTINIAIHIGSLFLSSLHGHLI